MDNVPFLIFLETAMDFWLKDHFQTSTPIIDLVYVTSKYPTYNFEVGDLVALVSAN
jgi:hypothetical protein